MMHNDDDDEKNSLLYYIDLVYTKSMIYDDENIRRNMTMTTKIKSYNEKKWRWWRNGDDDEEYLSLKRRKNLLSGPRQFVTGTRQSS